MEILLTITIMRPIYEGKAFIISGEFSNAEGTVFGSIHMAEVAKEHTGDLEIGKVVKWKI